MSGLAASSVNRRVDFIQALRGIGAMMVVLYHARPFINGPSYLDLGERFFRSGAAGVDLFFVISGFIMVYTTADSDGSWRYVLRFCSKRLSRVWPVYAITTLVFLAVTVGVGAFLESPKGGEQLARALLFLPQAIGPAPAYGFAPLGVGWTLNYEIWFYLFFGVTLLAGGRRWSATVAVFGGLLVLAPLAMTGTLHFSAYENYRIHPSVLNLMANPLTWDFVFGIAIGKLYCSNFKIVNLGLLRSGIALTAAFLVWQWFSPFGSGHGPTRWGTPIAVMVLLLALYDKRQPIAVPGWLRWLGEISFSLYLIHWIPYAALPMYVPSEYAYLISGGGFFVSSIVVVLVISGWSHRWVEVELSGRFRRGLLRLLDRHPAPSATGPRT